MEGNLFLKMKENSLLEHCITIPERGMAQIQFLFQIWLIKFHDGCHIFKKDNFLSSSDRLVHF